METLHILIFIGIIHLIFLFFNTIFVSCMHLPYLTLLKRCGIEIQLLRIKWFTTSFNRSLMRWGLSHSKFWTTWFSTGLIITIMLLPLSIIAILKMTIDNWSNETEFSNENKAQSIELMIPGVNIPYNQMGYYILSLILSSTVHELGHAMAAVRDDVRFFGFGMILFFIIPVAYVDISDEQLKSLPIKNHLKILCAGIWHNIVLAGMAVLCLGLVTYCFSPFFKINSGIYIKDIASNSPLLGPSGLLTGDVVHKVNDCNVKNSTDWQTCILLAIQQPSPGYCMTEKMIKQLDKSVTVPEKKGDLDCCDQYNKDKGYMCLEHLEGFDIQISRSIVTRFCLPIRVVVESSHNSCQNNDNCVLLNDLCIKPVLDNTTKIVQIQRYGHKDVLFFGHPSEIYYTTEWSDWVPRFSFLSPNFPEAVILLCKYIAVFSLGLAVINVVPCFYFDGQHITKLLIDLSLKNKVHQQNTRTVISFVISFSFTLLLGYNLLNAYLNKIS